jgi:hypothetical protein
MATPVQTLEIQTGKHRGRKIRLARQGAVIGRTETAKIRIASTDVSREHCVLTPQADGVLVKDLNSRNGTFIDGRPISEEKLLLPGSTLTVGPMTFLLLGEKREEGSEKPGKVSVAGKSSVDESLSDDEIASWLSTDELPSAASTSDTTIITHPDQPSGSTAEMPSSAKAARKEKKREFATVAEEARDIIRRHLEMQAEQPTD